MPYYYHTLKADKAARFNLFRVNRILHGKKRSAILLSDYCNNCHKIGGLLTNEDVTAVLEGETQQINVLAPLN